MAKEAPSKAEATSEIAPTGKKNRVKYFILAGVVMLVFAIAGIAALLLLRNNAQADQDGAETYAAGTPESGKPDTLKPPIFVPMEAFTVNLQPDGEETVLQMYATLRVADEKVGEQVKVFMPQIRHEVLSLLSGKLRSEITTPQGREGLASEIRDTINTVLGWPPAKKRKVAQHSVSAVPAGPVMKVFFTQFIVQ